MTEPDGEPENVETVPDARTGKPTLLRDHDADHGAVSNLELFFDLVFVFAVTQLSHSLIEHLTIAGAVETAILFLAVWWAWMFTTWATNWLEPDRGPTRVMLGMVMLASMVMSASITRAFGNGGLTFAIAYCSIQIGRTLYTAWAIERADQGSGRNMLRAAIWFAAACPLWIGGALMSDDVARAALWCVALGIEYLGPLVMFAVPGLGRSTLKEWTISGRHMAERCGLFIIIALGEGLLLTGATFSRTPGERWLELSLVAAFAGSFAMWWLYFTIGARRGADHIEHHAMPGLVARQAFTYWHIPIVAGIVMLAVADELLLAHPRAPVHGEFVAVLTSGMVMFLVGLMGFKRISSRAHSLPFSHWIGLAATASMALWGLLAHPATLHLYAVSVAVFVLVSTWEWGSFKGGWMERMEARQWRLGALLRRRTDARRARQGLPLDE